MSSLFDELDDETPPSVGQEIGAAMSGAIVQINKANSELATMIADAMKEAIAAVESKKIVLQSKTPEPVTKWVFKIERDSKGLLKSVTAEAA